MLELLAADYFGRSPRKVDRFEHYVTYTRLGYRLNNAGVAHMADVIFDELRARGLAGDFTPPAGYRDGGELIGVHMSVWAVISMLLAHFVRPAGLKRNLDLQPVTRYSNDFSSTVDGLAELGWVSRSRVISFDLEHVGIDLSLVPLDELIDFRVEHAAKYRSYVRNLRTFLQEQAATEDDRRHIVWAQRRDELAEAAHELQKVARTAWRRPAAMMSLGISGCVWAALQGDIPSAVIALLSGIVGAEKAQPPENPYAYIFEAWDHLGHRYRMS
jgi:hypothetical protein